MSKRIFVTGATGYLGTAAADALQAAGYEVARGTRRPMPPQPERCWIEHGPLESSEGWEQALAGCRIVVHFAGRAHVRETPAGATEAQRVNADGTANIARAAVAAGIERFVLVSSALVCGAASPPGRPFTEDDAPNPATAYARSKWDAEHRLRQIAEDGGMQWVAVRPPMVYGPRSPGNFHRLARLVATGLPVPLGAATAPKSFVGVDNLCSAVCCVSGHAAVHNETVIVCDDETTSTADLIGLMAAALGRPARLLRVPVAALRAAAAISGRRSDVARLLDPLAFSNAKLKRLTGWTPPRTLAQGVAHALSSQADGDRPRPPSA